MSNSKIQPKSRHTSQAIELPVSAEKVDWLKSKIRDIPDFPKPGIVFKDLTTLLKDKEAFAYVIDVLAARFEDWHPKYVAGVEARGFIVGAALAYRLGIGFLPIRKPGKLPYQVEKISYELEYGTDCLEIHIDAVDTGAIEKGKEVILVDDLLATGGTAVAASKLLTTVGAKLVGVGFLVELGFLSGRANFPAGLDIFSVLDYQ